MSDNSGDQHNPSHVLTGADLAVQMIPSELAATPPPPTATNKPIPLHHTTFDNEPPEMGFVLDVQLIPSGLVMMKPPVADSTATKSPRSGDQHTSRQALPDTDVRAFHALSSTNVADGSGGAMARRIAAARIPSIMPASPGRRSASMCLPLHA
jgi:hypothetical protein